MTVRTQRTQQSRSIWIIPRADPSLLVLARGTSRDIVSSGFPRALGSISSAPFDTISRSEQT